ncbi:MAG: HAMP domain-containing histidine kinase [Lachnospiraceae bacterium]|nr:HAMP domain-containing histidine kinase [Lachnospiraceae bacterium]
MKIKFWQKTWLLTMALFLISFNIGVLIIYTYHKNLLIEEIAAFEELYYVGNSFEQDYQGLAEVNPQATPALMCAYGRRYLKKDMPIAFYKEGSDSAFHTTFSKDISMESNSVAQKTVDGTRYLLISMDVCDGEYQIIVAKDINSFDSELRIMLYVYMAISGGISVVLAVVLYFVLKKLSEPLSLMRKTTEKIEAGDYSARVEEQGNDEFTVLAKSFNLMLTKINEQMRDLEREAEERKLEAQRKQMLVDNMAHELRTPLTSIHGYAEYLEKANVPEQRRLIAERYIISESERLQKVSEILLDSAFIRENKVEMSEADLAAVLTDVSEKLRWKADASQIKLGCNASPAPVMGNETLLSMLFYNLTDNAIKACQAGGRVCLSCCGDQAVVEDNGKGMTREQLGHITEPFYRTDQSRSRAEGGAGLGLALCSQIVQAHGADMHFESEPGKGTRVIITFTSWQ